MCETLKSLAQTELMNELEGVKAIQGAYGISFREEEIELNDRH